MKKEYSNSNYGTLSGIGTSIGIGLGRNGIQTSAANINGGGLVDKPGLASNPRILVGTPLGTDVIVVQLMRVSGAWGSGGTPMGGKVTVDLSNPGNVRGRFVGLVVDPGIVLNAGDQIALLVDYTGGGSPTDPSDWTFAVDVVDES